MSREAVLAVLRKFCIMRPDVGDLADELIAAADVGRPCVSCGEIDAGHTCCPPERGATLSAPELRTVRMCLDTVVGDYNPGQHSERVNAERLHARLTCAECDGAASVHGVPCETCGVA